MNKKTTIGIIIAILIFAGMGLQIYFADQRIDSLEIGTKGHLELFHHYPLTTKDVILQHIIDSCSSDDVWFITRCQQTLSKHIIPEHTPSYNINDYIAWAGQFTEKDYRGTIIDITYFSEYNIFNYKIKFDNGYYANLGENSIIFIRASNFSN